MNHRTFSLMWLEMVVASIALAELPLGENLLPNGGFEKVSKPGAAPDGWSFIKHGESVQCSVENGAVQLTSGGLKDIAYCVCSGKTAVKPGRYYAISARIKLDNISPTSHRTTVLYYWRTANDKTKGVHLWEVSGTRDWQNYRRVVRAPLDAAALGPFYLGVYQATGTAYFDDVALQEVNLPPERFFPDKDGYGYAFPLHSPDHHVCSGLAAAMIMGYEVTADRRYLDSAALFVRQHVPHYGFHSGLWRGHRYYWTEYNPTGPGNPVDDATDNIQALVAQPVAMLGYHLNDRRYLEYARGLLWHLCREWHTDKRWYYDGWENPINKRYSVSHDESCIHGIMRSLPYLVAAGVDCAALLDGLEGPLRFYITHRDSRWPYVRGNKVMGSWDEAAPGKPLRFATFIQVTGPGARQVKFVDKLPDEFIAEEPLKLTMTQVGGAIKASLEATVKQLSGGVPLDLPMKPGQIYRIEYQATCPPGFSPTPTPPDTKHRPTADPRVPPSRMTFVNELHEQLSQDFPSQAWETLKKVNAHNFLTFDETLWFPRPERRR